jgi:hypothetical protein
MAKPSLLRANATLGLESKDVIPEFVVPELPIEGPEILIVPSLGFPVSTSTLNSHFILSNELVLRTAKHFQFNESHLLNIRDQNRMVVEKAVQDKHPTLLANRIFAPTEHLPEKHRKAA